MFKYFANRFIDDYRNFDDPKTRLELISLSSIIVIVINLLLVAVKLTIGYFSNSTAIMNDGFNNLADSIVSLMALVGSKVSQKPADSHHPHGYGRGESIITLLVSILIIYVGGSLLLNSLGHFKDESQVSLTALFIIILILSIFAKVYIFRLNRKLYMKLDSDLNYGVMVDARNDILITISIIVAAFIDNYVAFNVDAVMGIILAVLIFIPGVELFRSTVSYLMGNGISQETEAKIGEIILDNDFIVGFHGLEIHDYGRGHLDGTVDVEIADNISLLVAHKIITKIQKRIKRELGISLSIHMDPTYSLLINNDIQKQIVQLEKQARDEYDDF